MLLAAICFAKLAHADDRNFSAVSGTWIIEARYHDQAIESGALMDEYPVLVIDADDNFLAYRLGTDCTEDPLVRAELPEHEKLTHYSQTEAVRHTDLAVAPAILVTEGVIKVSIFRPL